MLNLILGLIYSLIYRYHIQKKVKERPIQISSAKSVNVSASTALLSWIDWKVAKYVPKDKKIRNLSTDWNDGIALCALIESIEEGTCPECTEMSGDDRLGNCKNGLRLGEEHFKIPKIISAEHLSHREIDETSVMIYLCYYLEFWCRKPNPDVPEHIVQFLDDAGLVEAFPSKPDTKQTKSNCLDALQPADASKCIVDLAFLRRSVFTVGETIIFTVDCTNAGKGHLDVKAYAIANKEKNIASKSEKTFAAGVSIFDCFLKAETVGAHELVIQWEGEHIKDSPLRFEICNPKAIVLENIKSRHNTFVGDTITFDVDISRAGSADLLQVVFSDQKRKCEKIPSDIKVTFIYRADTIGSTELSIYFNNSNMKTIEIVVASECISSNPDGKMQFTIFTEYINYVFKTSSKGTVSNLQWGFQSGVSLVSLLEQFSGKKINCVGSVSAEPENRSQMIDILNLCFTFMKSENLPMPDISEYFKYNCTMNVLYLFFYRCR